MTSHFWSTRQAREDTDCNGQNRNSSSQSFDSFFCSTQQCHCLLFGRSIGLGNIFVVRKTLATGEFIKQHLAKFQFAAVAITILLGANTIYDRFFKTSLPVLIWDPEGFNINPTNSYSNWQVAASRKKFRDDCPLRSFDAHIIDRDGFVHQITTSANRSVGKTSDGFENFQFLIKINDIESVPGGPAKLRGILVYECKEGQQVIEYPESQKLVLEIPSGSK